MTHNYDSQLWLIIYELISTKKKFNSKFILNKIYIATARISFCTAILISVAFWLLSPAADWSEAELDLKMTARSWTNWTNSPRSHWRPMIPIRTTEIVIRSLLHLFKEERWLIFAKFYYYKNLYFLLPMVLIIPSSLLKCSPGNLNSNEKKNEISYWWLILITTHQLHIPDS